MRARSTHEYRDPGFVFFIDKAMKMAPSLYEKLVRTSLYVRVCTHGSVRACLYTRVCTYVSVLTNCTYGPARARLYACAEQWLGRYTQLTAPSSQHAAPQLTAHIPQLTAASSQPPARNSQLIALSSQLTARRSQLTTPNSQPRRPPCIFTIDCVQMPCTAELFVFRRSGHRKCTGAHEMRPT